MSRERPGLPANFDDPPIVNAESLAEFARLEDRAVSGADFSGHNLPSIHASCAAWDGVSLAGCTIPTLRLRDVRVVRCDLSNAVFRIFEARRVEFIECRLSGMKAIECRWRDVLVENCQSRYAQYNDGVLHATEFRSTRLEDADFRGADLEGALFDHAVLVRADLTGAKLNGADLRGADIEGITVRAEDVRGAIVTPAQAMGLARLLGLVIR